MASTYQIVPYLMSVGLRGSTTELRPLANVDARGTSLQTAVARIAAASRGRGFIDPDDRVRKLELDVLLCGERTVLMQWHPGRSGIESRIRRPDGSEVPRTTFDTEFVPVRHVLYSPPGASHALLLTERVGVMGAVTMSSRLIKGTFQKYFPELRLDLAPAVTTEVLRKLMADQPIKSLIFTRPRRGDQDGRLIKVSGESVELEVRMRPRRSHWWTINSLPREPDTEQVTAASLLGVLAPRLMPGANEGSAVESLLEEGWQAALEVKFPNGTHRRVNVASNQATTMSFPIIPSGEDVGDRPTDEQFRAACGSTLQLFEGQYGLGPGSGENCRWDQTEWDDGAGWEVQWDEPSSTTATTT